MLADVSDMQAIAEYALLRAALVSALLRAAASDCEIVSLTASVSRATAGQFDVDVEFLGHGGVPVGGMSV